MSMYLARFTLTPSTWARLIEKPEDRRLALEPVIAAAGGKLHGFWSRYQNIAPSQGRESDSDAARDRASGPRAIGHEVLLVRLVPCSARTLVTSTERQSGRMRSKRID